MCEYKAPEWLYANETPFGSLSLDDKAELFKAWVSGETVEYRYCLSNTWYVMETPVWQHRDIYRVKPKPPVPDSIDWSHVSPELKYMARDANGWVLLFEDVPRINSWDTGWTSRGVYANAKCFLSYKRGTVSWIDSLIKRPE